MEPPIRIPVGRWRAGLHDRRLSGLRPDDAEPGQARERASPVEAVRRGHDERPADARAEGGVRFDSRLFREPRGGGSAWPWSPGAKTWRSPSERSAGTEAWVPRGARTPRRTWW